MEQHGEHSVSPARVDVSVLESAARRLLPASSECRHLAADVLRHAPDAGPNAAGEAVAALMTAAVDALDALADALDESAGLLGRAAGRYAAGDAAVATSLRRISGGLLVSVTHDGHLVSAIP